MLLSSIIKVLDRLLRKNNTLSNDTNASEIDIFDCKINSFSLRLILFDFITKQKIRIQVQKCFFSNYIKITFPISSENKSDTNFTN